MLNIDYFGHLITIKALQGMVWATGLSVMVVSES